MPKQNDRKFQTIQLVRIALLGAILYVVQIGLSFIPNLELVSFLICIYALLFGKQTFWMILVFNLFEGIQWGFGVWWISYLYVWPLLLLIVLLLKKMIKEEFILWAIILGIWGLIFGSLFAIAYIPVDPHYALTYWISGLPWDVWHGGCNFVVMLIAGKPVYHLLLKALRMDERRVN